MAFGGKKKIESPEKNSQKNVGINAYIGEGTVFEGHFEFTGIAQITGKLIGDITSGGTLVIGEKGDVSGKINVSELKSAGTISGEVSARQKITLYKSAVMTGNLETPALEVEEGASLEGEIRMKALKKT